MDRDTVIVTLTRHSSLFEKAYLFGSTARGEADEHCDADVIIVRRSEKDSFHRVTEVMDIVLELSGADLLIYTPAEFQRMKETSGFIQTVLGEAIVVEGQQ